MDIIAKSSASIRLEFRLRHLFEAAMSRPGRSAPLGDLRECLQRAAAEIGWYEQKRPGEGRGLACIWKWTVPGTLSQALVKVHEDGTVGVMTGIADLGTGSSTIMAQIAAEELGVDVENVGVVVGDTELTPYDYGSASVAAPCTRAARCGRRRSGRDGGSWAGRGAGRPA
jgi:CO/xanthine dehydrogenase Mo-binding subunit